MQLGLRHAAAAVPQRAGEVRQPDADLAVGVHHEAGAVEAARRGAAPDVRARRGTASPRPPRGRRASRRWAAGAGMFSVAAAGRAARRAAGLEPPPPPDGADRRARRRRSSGAGFGRGGLSGSRRAARAGAAASSAMRALALAAPPARAARSRSRGPTPARASRRCAASMPLLLGAGLRLELRRARHAPSPAPPRAWRARLWSAAGRCSSSATCDLRALQQVGGVEHPADRAGREDRRERVRVAVLVVLHELLGQDVAAGLQVAAHQRDALLVEGDVGLHLRRAPPAPGSTARWPARDPHPAARSAPAPPGPPPAWPGSGCSSGRRGRPSWRRRGRARRVAVGGSSGVGWTSCGSPRGFSSPPASPARVALGMAPVRPACVRAARQPERPHAEHAPPDAR